MSDILQDAGAAQPLHGRNKRRTPAAQPPQAELALAPAQAAPLAQAAPARATMTPMDMLAIAVERGASVEELNKLWEIAEKVRQQQAQQAFVSAMTRFKENPPTIQKTREADVKSRREGAASFAYKYANLADVCNGIIEHLAAVGISHDWTTRQADGQVAVTCTLTHEQGHGKSTTLAAGLDMSGNKNNLQGLGSAVSYLERYTLLAVCGLALDDQQDDDGAAGITPGERQELQAAARELREGAVSPLLQRAQAAADKGHTSFGAFWRGITEQERRTLADVLPGLQQRASSAKVS